MAPAGQRNSLLLVSTCLSIEPRPLTGGSVLNRSAPSFDRLIAALCALLMMFYAATMPAKAADQIQHAPGLMIAHDHSGATDFAIYAVPDNQDDHAGHHDEAPVGDDEPGNPLAGGHHHHGDSGPNLLFPSATTAAAMTPSSRLHGIEKDRHIAGLRSIGPERPPRTISLNV